MANPNLYDDLMDLKAQLDGILSRFQQNQRPPSGELFDFSNRAHRMVAEEAFRRHNVRERGQSFFYNKYFIGVRVADLDAVVEQRQAEYRKNYPMAARGRP